MSLLDYTLVAFISVVGAASAVALGALLWLGPMVLP